MDSSEILARMQKGDRLRLVGMYKDQDPRELWLGDDRLTKEQAIEVGRLLGRGVVDVRVVPHPAIPGANVSEFYLTAETPIDEEARVKLGRGVCPECGGRMLKGPGALRTTLNTMCETCHVEFWVAHFGGRVVAGGRLPNDENETVYRARVIYGVRQ